MMSIETLLEAAKFLELQAQQQQKAREENDLREKLRLEQLTDQRRSEAAYAPPIHINNHVARAEERRLAPAAPPPRPLPPASMPITVIPIPVVTSNHTGLPQGVPLATTLSPPAASPRRDPYSPQDQSSPLPLSPPLKADHSSPPLLPSNQKQPLQQQQNHHHHHHHHHPQAISPPGSIKLQQQQQLVQRYPGSIVTAPQHTLLPQPAPPPLQPPLQTAPISRGSPPDDGRNLDGKKRPGGTGTREVHNKLEKNRRAHLKECFETLKKNIPNVDEKKTSNLSVLRSALRYIQTLKRKEKEYEHEMERLAREKIATQQRLAELKNELSQWMDVMEIDRVLRQTVQPEEDQASTSTASEGEEDIMDDDLDEENVPRAPAALPAVPQAMQPELRKTVTPTLTPTPTTTSIITQHISIQHKAPPHHPLLQPQPAPQPMTVPLPLPKPPSTPTATMPGAPTHIQALLPTQTHMVTAPTQTHMVTAPTQTHMVAAPNQTHMVAAPNQTHMVTANNQTHMVTSPSLQPTVIAHASASHASVIQAVNHVIQAGGGKHIAHLAPSTAPNSMQLAPGHQPIGHITVHPVTHLGQHLPTLYPQPMAVAQSAMVGHIAHTLTHAQVNGTAPSQPTATIVGKQTSVGTQVMAHHPQLVGQTVLNPVTMVTMPSFPVSTLKLA